MEDTISVAVPHVQFIDRRTNTVVLIPAILAASMEGHEFTLTLSRPEFARRDAKWITLAEAVTQHIDDVDNSSEDSARMRIRREGRNGKFQTNGKPGRELRIDPTSFAAWRLRQREINLANEDED